VIGINPNSIEGGNDGPQSIQNFILQTGVTFPMVDDTLNTYNQWTFTPSVSPYPLDIVVDRQGIIQFVTRDYDADALKAAVLAQLN
jgi:peroxiredoxin